MEKIQTATGGPFYIRRMGYPCRPIANAFGLDAGIWQSGTKPARIHERLPYGSTAQMRCCENECIFDKYNGKNRTFCRLRIPRTPTFDKEPNEKHQPLYQKLVLTMCLYGYSNTKWPLARMTDRRFIFRIFEPPRLF